MSREGIALRTDRRPTRRRYVVLAALTGMSALALSVAAPLAATAATPVALDDAYWAAQEVTLDVPAPGVLANDTDADAGDVVLAGLISTTAHGTLSLSPDGSFSYVPDAGFAGTDSFTYLASDASTSSNTATVTITVVPPNTSPVAFDDAYTTPFDTTLVVADPGVLGNDTDAEGNFITFTSVVTAPTHGTLVPNATGGFTYTPNPGHAGVDTFTYRANDGGGTPSNIATVTVTTLAAAPPAPPAPPASAPRLPDTGAALSPTALAGAVGTVVLGGILLGLARHRRAAD